MAVICLCDRQADAHTALSTACCSQCAATGSACEATCGCLVQDVKAPSLCFRFQQRLRTRHPKQTLGCAHGTGPPANPLPNLCVCAVLQAHRQTIRRLMLASGVLVTSAASLYVGYKVYKSVSASSSSISTSSGAGGGSSLRGSAPPSRR
jgi:hypothetical protein